MAENLLDIVTAAERPTFTVDGRHYEMRHPDELSMVEFTKLATAGAALERLGQHFGDDPVANIDELTASMNELYDLVTPDLPQDVRDKLNPVHLQRLLQSFMALVRIGDSPAEQPNPPKLSPDSSDSTAAAPNTG